MDYKKLYIDALNRAKKLYEQGTITESLGYVFPELTEDEDENTRKELLGFIKNWKNPSNIGRPSDFPMFTKNKEQCDKYIAWLEKQGEKKPTDKVEPKFKVGDWISGYYTNYKVMAINSKGYMVEDTDGNKINILFENEKFHHLFTIEDAKDGDVLVTNAIRNCPFIYRKTNYNNNLAYYYAGIDGSGDFCEGCIKRTSYHFGPLSNVVPATKEQRDQLFQKMEKAGYKWNAEKKELKNIEVVSKESKDERIKKTIIRILKGEIGYTSKEDIDKYVTWLEKQGKRLGADKVIAWLVANICDFEYYVKLFKKDFGL